MYAKMPRLIRTANQLMILNTLRTQSMARSELARTLHMSGPSVSKHVDQLIDMKLVTEAASFSDGPGRRRIPLSFNPKRGFACAVELCANNARLILTDLDGAIIDEHTIPYNTPDSLILALVVKQIGRMLMNHTSRPEKLLGICLMNGHVPRLAFTPSDELFSALIELKEMLQEKYHIPIYIENSTYMAAYGEGLDSQSNSGTLLYVYVGDTISAAISAKDSIGLPDWHTRIFGELNDFIPDTTAAIAEWRGNSLSKRNTLGAQATLTAIMRISAEKFTPGEGFLGEHLASSEELAPEDICAGAGKGDSACLFSLQNAAIRLSACIVNLSYILDFDEVVIGGPIQRLGAVYLRCISEFLNEWLNLMTPIPVRWSASGDNAMLYGGARRAADGAIEVLLGEDHN